MAILLGCAVSAKCGGCQMAKISYEEQLSIKEKKVRALLGGFGVVRPILGMRDPYHYRNKVHAAFSADKRGNVISGVYEAGTHRVVPVERCMIEDQKADAIIGSVRELLKAFNLRPYNEYTRRGLLRHAVVRAARATGQYMAVLVTAASDFPASHAFADALMKKHPELTTVVQNLNARATSMVLGTHDRVLRGSGYIEDILCGKRFRISPQSFYQVNPVQTEMLYKTAIELAALGGKETILDAYCGIGTIGLVASDACARVFGVELNAQAVRDANTNAAINGVNNAVFAQGDAGQKMIKWAEKGGRLDAVFLDPPRAGSDAAFLTALCRMSPARVVYVSCNPETLARDAAFLIESGYRMDTAVPVDMFPFTEHVETVCLFIR